jgi:DNA-binding GntR family transcriptional regulator
MLRSAILSGALEPDSRLYEHRIAAELGVSRTPVREALAMLEAEELVVSVPGKGSVVRRITPDEVRETYDVRAVLEGHAASLAAERIRAPELAKLRRLARDMRRALARAYPSEDRRVDDIAGLNAEFHKTVAAAGGNRVLERTIEGLIDAPLYARAYFWYRDPGKQASFDDHERMIELLAAGDPDACESFWREHLLRGRDYLIEYLETGGST